MTRLCTTGRANALTRTLALTQFYICDGEVHPPKAPTFLAVAIWVSSANSVSGRQTLASRDFLTDFCPISAHFFNLLRVTSSHSLF